MLEYLYVSYFGECLIVFYVLLMFFGRLHYVAMAVLFSCVAVMKMLWCKTVRAFVYKLRATSSDFVYLFICINLIRAVLLNISF